MDSYDEEADMVEENSMDRDSSKCVEVVTVTKMDVIQKQLDDLKVLIMHCVKFRLEWT